MKRLVVIARALPLPHQFPPAGFLNSRFIYLFISKFISLQSVFQEFTILSAGND